MRRLITMFAAFVVVACASAGAQSRDVMYDPLFGIGYYPQTVHFDPMPPLIEKACPRLRNTYSRAWVYAHLKTADGEYFIVSGFLKRYVNGRATEGDQDFGLAIAITPSKCIDDPSEYFLRQGINTANGATPIIVSESVLRGISEHALNHYAKAFNGKKNFLRQVTQWKLEGVPPVVRNAFEKFKKDVSVN